MQKIKFKNLSTTLTKEKYKLALKEHLKTTKDENGFLRIDYRLLTNI
jgi:hypothetical protein